MDYTFAGDFSLYFCFLLIPVFWHLLPNVYWVSFHFYFSRPELSFFCPSFELTSWAILGHDSI